MKANLPSLASTRERIQSRIHYARTPADRKSLTKSSNHEEFEESTADLTSAATSYQHSLQTPPSASKPKVQRLERSEPADCYQSVVSDVTWQEQEVATSSRRRSLSSNPILSPVQPPQNSLYHHGYSTSEQRVGSAVRPPSNYGGNYQANLSKPSSFNKPHQQYRQHKPNKRSSVESVVSELTWNEPTVMMTQESSSLLDAPRSPPNRTQTEQFWSTSSPPLKTTSVLEKLGRKNHVSDAQYFASRGQEGYRAALKESSSSSPKQPSQRQRLTREDSLSSIVSDVTWIDLDSSGHRGGPSLTTDDSPPDSLNNSVRSQGKSSKSNFHDSGVSELTFMNSDSSIKFMNSESSLKISDLMRTSIKEAANESSGSPCNSGGSKELQGSSSNKEASSRELTESNLKMALEKSISEPKQESLYHSFRLALKENDAMPTKPTRKMSSSSDDAWISESDAELEHSSELSLKPSTSTETSSKDGLPPSSEHSVEKSKFKKRRSKNKREQGHELGISDDSADSLALDEGPSSARSSKKRCPKAGTKSKRVKPKKSKKKKKEDSEHSRVSMSESAKPNKRRQKKKKSKDSDRSKLDDSEHGLESKLKKAHNIIKKKKKKKKSRLDDSERTEDSEATNNNKTMIATSKRPEESERTERTHDSNSTLKTKISRKKLDDSNPSLFGVSDRTNQSSNSTFDLDEVPELKEIGVPKNNRRRGELDGSNHSTQSAFELGYSGSQPKTSSTTTGRRSSRGRNGDLDDASIHSVQSCLEMQTTRLSIPKPSALAGEPTRPALVRQPSKSERKSVMFGDGVPSRPPGPPVTFTKKEVSRDWGESSLDRLPKMSFPNRNSPASLRAKRVAQASRRASIELRKTPEFNPSSPSDGVNFLLDRLSASESSNDGSLVIMPRSTLSHDSSDEGSSPGALAEASLPPPPSPALGTPTKLSPRDKLREKLGLKPSGVSPPKLDAREKLGLMPTGVTPPSVLFTPAGKRIVGKEVMGQRRRASNVRKGEVFDSMNKMMSDELSVEE